MNLKKIAVLLLSLVVIMGANAFAQKNNNNNAQRGGNGGQRGPGQDSAMIVQRTEKLAKDLSLTNDQKTKILDLQFANAKEMQAKRNDNKANNGDREAMMKAREESRKKLENDIKNVLDENQKKKYAEMLEKQEQQRQNRMNNGGGNGNRQNGGKPGENESNQ